MTYILGKWEENHITVGRRGWDTVLPKPYPQHSDPQPGENSKPRDSLQRVKVQTLHQAPQLLVPAPERWAPKISNFENHKDSCLETHKIVTRCEKALKVLCAQIYLPQGQLRSIQPPFQFPKVVKQHTLPSHTQIL